MQTPLHAQHLSLGAKMVDFHGWSMPLHYGSQIEEHLTVRRHAGLFDVSHMTVVDVDGIDATTYLRRLLANDVAAIEPSRAMYSCMLNEQGGVVDDLICYRLAGDQYRLVVNSSTKSKDLAWLAEQAGDAEVNLTHQQGLAIVAVQGPNAISLVAEHFPSLANALSTLRPFRCVTVGDWLVARTGYTGEDGLEIVLPASDAPAFWTILSDLGVAPCGLGARDTLRLEAGLNLYGQDMDQHTSPLCANLAWTVSWADPDRAFIGKPALEAEKTAGVSQQFVGLVLQDKGVLRQGQQVVIEGIGEGIITSGGFSPTLEKGIAFARIPSLVNSHDWGQTFVNIRDKLKPVEVVTLPFVRKGNVVYQPLKEGESA